MIFSDAPVVTGSVNRTVRKPSPKSDSGMRTIPAPGSEPVATPGDWFALTPDSYCTINRLTAPSKPFVGITSTGPAISLAPISLVAVIETEYETPFVSPLISVFVRSGSTVTLIPAGSTEMTYASGRSALSGSSFHETKTPLSIG